MTWFVAAQASVNAGKRMPDNAEWQASALGTARSSGNGITNGSDWSPVMDQDVSRYGVIGMAGNVWEWVADWIQAGMTWQSNDGQSVATWPSGKGYGDDYTWNINGRAYNGSSWVDGAPVAPLRGGYWDTFSAAGVFALSAHGAPSDWSSGIGFRYVR
jgi:formylglycine-generating enzyme required for sulfatase activity